MIDTISIHNVVATCTADTKIPLSRLAMELEKTEYEPEQFPGLVYRLDFPKTVFLLFSSGKVICTGGKSEKDIEESVIKLKENLKEIKAI